MSNSDSARRLGTACTVAAIFAGVFALPFAVPTHNVSPSGLSGYSNHAALIALILGVLIFAFAKRAQAIFLVPAESEEKLSAVVVAIFVVAAVAGCAMVWATAARTQPAMEACYFLDRLHELQLGGRPFLDFTFDYGPLLLYPSAWMSRASGISLAGAYYLAWTTQWVLGLAALAFVTNSLRGSRQAKTWAFALCTTLWLTSVVDSGAQYTPLRFIGGSVAAVVALRLYTTGRRFAWPVWCIVGFVALFLYSTEQGLAFLLATVAFFLVCSSGPRPWLGLVTFAAACAFVVVLGNRYHLLDSIRIFGGGAYDLPLLLTPTTAAWLFCMLIAAMLGVHAWVAQRRSLLELYLLFIAAAGLPAAVGRADSGHLFINTLPAVLIVTVCLFEVAGTRRALATTAWTLVIYSAFALHFWSFRRVLFTRHALDRTAAGEREASHLRKMLPEGETVFAPFGFISDYRLDNLNPVTTGRYFGYVSVPTKPHQAETGGIAGSAYGQLDRT